MSLLEENARMGTLVKRSLGDQIVDFLRDRIIAGTLPLDAPIRQDALAQELGVSKIPLREAFARLEQDGLVVSEANRGYFVSPLSAAEAFDVFDLRLRIEPDVVAVAAPLASPEARHAARDLLHSLNEATLKGEGERNHRIGALNRAFHVALIRPAGRRVTEQMVERLQVIAERYVVKHLEPGGRADRAVAEHDALFAAWAVGDAADAATLAAAHIARTRDDLRAQLDSVDCGAA